MKSDRSPKTGLLLVNLGTPDSPAPGDVRRYLREFLSDPRVLDMNSFGRWLLLNLVILPRRPRESGKAYEQIWTEEGSPLLIHTEALTRKVQALAPEDVHVDFAMRYGNPSIADVLARFRDRGIDNLIVFPLYPQYSSAANGSSLERVFSEAAKLWNVPAIS
ncbi:MAG: ferrochelatase, partial [Acidobacteriota bacterium]|nr:ferrochelatase [Acidobacteriota bacterium]